MNRIVVSPDGFMFGARLADRLDRTEAPILLLFLAE
jgi:hypothetical protein